ncbi:MAG: malto-oligosyltrehalose trehalohydrolase [Chthoniobacterales bacterium]
MSENFDSSLRTQGAELVPGGVRYRTWCKHREASVRIVDREGKVLRELGLQAEGDGYFSVLDAQGAAGDLYQYRFGGSQGWPDPTSRWQPEGVHGPSMVIDPAVYRWETTDWSAPAMAELVIYELHVGTFTPVGTFRSAIERLDHLVRLGVTAVELMPVADFPGERNWGYDGVMLYAPARAYGSPDDLRALVDAAHARGLAVILDVVYNHLGPDGNYTGVYHHGYVNPELHTPWGAALNYAAAAARAFFVENAVYWRREFRIDGFRLDATHAIADQSPTHLLAEIADRVHSLGGFVIAEDERNEPSLVRPVSKGGFGLDGVWADDFHHILRVMLTGQRDGYFADFSGTAEELADTVNHGWLYRGQARLSDGTPRGGETDGLARPQFVYCISNHDQIGNRAFGERLEHTISAAAYRAVSALLCLVPETPLLFMGQEWSASTPFQFFTDHNPELGRLVTQGRRQEFGKFEVFRDPKMRATIPDPQARSTFDNSKLRWAEVETPGHGGVLRLYRECLALRRTQPAWRADAREGWEALSLGEGMIALVWRAAAESACLILCDLLGRAAWPALEDARFALSGEAGWKQVLSTNEERFAQGYGGEARPAPAASVYTASAAQ